MTRHAPTERRRRLILAKAAAAREALSGIALSEAARRHKISPATLRRALETVRGVEPGEWIEALTPDYSAVGRRPATPIDPVVWRTFRSDYLRPEQPSAASCHGRLRAWCKQHAKELPTLRQLQRQLKKIPAPQLAAARGGQVELDRMFPAQQRSVQDVQALERVSGDGWPVDVFVEHLDGRIIRPCLWVWQDVRSRKALAWRVGETESASLVMSSFRELCMEFGIPQHAHIDNTRAVSADWITAGQRGRKRYGDAGEFSGAFKSLGVRVHFSQLVATDMRTASGRRRNRGRGQSKPVERLFRILSDELARHPALRGFYSGPSTTAKPANYNSGSAGANWYEFCDLVDSVIRRINAKQGRQTEMAAGEKSADQVFGESLTEATVQRATPEQLDDFLAPAETIKVARDGSVKLSAGSAPTLGANRYWAEELYGYKGKRLQARYDPTDLHSGIRIFDSAGRFVCQASCLMPAGFGDADAAADHNRRRREFVRLHRRAEKARQRADQSVVNEIVRAEAAADSERKQEQQDTGTAGPRIIRMVPPRRTHQPAAADRAAIASQISAGWKSLGGDNDDE